MRTIINDICNSLIFISMKWTCFFILIVFLVQCKSPESDEKIDSKNKEQLDEWVKKEESIRKEKLDQEKALLKKIKKAKVKSDSFIAQFDTLYKFIDSTVFVKGIVQSSGIRDTSRLGFYTEFQLINPRKRFLLVTSIDISNFWGKCVTVEGKYLKGWNYESSDYFGSTAINLNSIESVSNNYCFNSPVFKPVSDNKFERHFRDSIYECYIHRSKRPSSDISYDYSIELIKSVDLNSDEWNNVKSLPLRININLDTLNFLIENKRKAKLYGLIIGGYAEGIVFDCKEYLGYE